MFFEEYYILYVYNKERRFENLRFDTEKYLLETLERITKNRAEYKVLYVNISKLKPKNRHPKFVKIITRLFDDLVFVANGTMFVLENGDFAILGKNVTNKIVNDVLEKLRVGLMSDPVWASSSSNEFIQVYESEDLDGFYRKIESMMNDENVVEDIVHRYPVEAEQMDAIKEHLDMVNITDVVKHQGVIRLENASNYRRLFDEYFVAVKDLSQNFDRNIDLDGNKWLFLYLTQSLDKKTMSSFMVSDIKNRAGKISLNLNLSTINSADFINFEQYIKSLGQRIIVEVQPIDVLNNMRLYFNVKEKLHKLGHEVLLDATSLEMLTSLNVAALEVDYIKLFWHDLMDEYNKQIDEIVNLFETIGKNKIILAKCLNEKAVRWGIKNGIRAFQGPYIDMLEVAMIRKNCPNGRRCTANDCLKRKKMISGYFRNMCEYKEILDREPR